MKISKRQLRRIIKEEKQKILSEQMNSSSKHGSSLIDFAKAYAGLGEMVQSQVEELSHEWLVQGAHVGEWDEAVYEQNPAAIRTAASRMLPFLKELYNVGYQEAGDLVNMFEAALEIYSKGDAEVEADARAAGDR